MASRNVFKLDMLILSILSKEDCYGYQLTQFIKKYSNNVNQTQPSSLYPILYRLIDQGYISDYEKVLKRNRKRVYYHLEPSGDEYFHKLLDDYYQLIQGIDGVLSCDIAFSKED